MLAKPNSDNDKRMIRELVSEFLQASPSKQASRAKILEATASNHEMPFVFDRRSAVNEVIDQMIKDRHLEVIIGEGTDQLLRDFQGPFVKLPKEWLRKK